MAKKSTTRKTVAPAKKTATKKAAPSNGRAALPKLSNRKTRETMIITKVMAENPRRKGTTGAKLFDVMVRYVKAHPKATVAELIAETNYRVQDFNWDLAHKHIEVARKSPNGDIHH